ncbi:hypothetical protein Q8F55_008542 [Vanrija albida]|uniref:Uncharacterized protein n=1 Tax=Vanrija albida TaxID=181172 RepID=A0ABR3PRB5_9TREE
MPCQPPAVFIARRAVLHYLLGHSNRTAKAITTAHVGAEPHIFTRQTIVDMTERNRAATSAQVEACVDEELKHPLGACCPGCDIYPHDADYDICSCIDESDMEGTDEAEADGNPEQMPAIKKRTSTKAYPSAPVLESPFNKTAVGADGANANTRAGKNKKKRKSKGKGKVGDGDSWPTVVITGNVTVNVNTTAPTTGGW